MARLTGLPVTHAEGDVIFRRGDAAADMFIVVEGDVDIVDDSGDVSVVLDTVPVGGFFGEMALFSPGPRTASAIARGSVVLEAVDMPTFQAFVGDPLVWNMCAKMAARLQAASGAVFSPIDRTSQDEE